MAIIKGLSGNVDITVDGKLRSFIDYGVPAGAVGGTFQVRANLSDTITDPTGPDSVTLVSASRGKIVPHTATPSFTVDLRGDSAVTDVDLVYDRTTGGNTERVNATISVVAPYFQNGWGEGRFYNPPRLSNYDLKILPHWNTRVVLCKDDGLSASDIIAAEPGLSSAPGDWGGWLRDNLATGGGGLHYGQRDDLALDRYLAMLLHKKLRLTPYTSPWLLFKRGSIFTIGVYEADTPGYPTPTTFETIGASALRPMLCGVYGNPLDPLPVHQGPGVRMVNGGNMVATGLTYNKAGSVNRHLKNICIDNVKVDFRATDGDANVGVNGDGIDNGVVRHISNTRIKSIGTFKKTAESTTWQTGDRESPHHPGDTTHTLYKYLLAMENGYSPRYRADRDVSEEKSPESQSHCIYHSVAEFDVTVQDVLGIETSGSFSQFRCGGVMEHCLSIRSNTGMTIGVGPQDWADQIGVDIYAGNYSMVYRYWQTDAGWASHWDGEPGPIAGGVDVGTQDLSLVDSGAVNAGTPRIYSSPLDTGPGYNPAETPLNSSYIFAFKLNQNDKTTSGNPGVPGTITASSNFVVANWYDSVVPNQAVNAAQASSLASLTVLSYAASVMGGTPTLEDFKLWLFDRDDPWVHIKAMQDQWCAVIGLAVPVPVNGEECVFEPDPTQKNPGFRADLVSAWKDKYLPGEALNNDVNLNGHAPNWNYTPKNPLRNLTFGPDGSLNQLGGELAFSGSINVDAGGNAWIMERGSWLVLDDHASPNLLTFPSITESLFCNIGTMTGKISMSLGYESLFVAWEGSSFTLDTGCTATFFGHSYPTFDGVAGGTASFIMNAGSTVEFRPATRMQISGMPLLQAGLGPSGGGTVNAKEPHWPKIGTIVRGLTSNATARVVEFMQISQTATSAVADLMLDTLSGTFLDGEDLEADETTFYDTFPTGQRTIGQVSGTPVHVLPSLMERQSGYAGFDGTTFALPATNVASAVTLGGTLHIDVTGMADATYTLIDVDTVTGVFDAVTAAGNGAKDLTVTISGTQVQVVVASGTGQISGGTS